jgi:hypothetical protein
MFKNVLLFMYVWNVNLNMSRLAQNMDLSDICP